MKKINEKYSIDMHFILYIYLIITAKLFMFSHGDINNIFFSSRNSLCKQSMFEWRQMHKQRLLLCM